MDFINAKSSDPNRIRANVKATPNAVDQPSIPIIIVLVFMPYALIQVLISLAPG